MPAFNFPWGDFLFASILHQGRACSANLPLGDQNNNDNVPFKRHIDAIAKEKEQSSDRANSTLIYRLPGKWKILVFPASFCFYLSFSLSLSFSLLC